MLKRPVLFKEQILKAILLSWFFLGVAMGVSRADESPKAAKKTLMIVAYNGDHGDYSRIIENIGVEIVQRRLAPHYDSIEILKGVDATPEQMLQTLQRRSSERGRILDLIVLSHGSYSAESSFGLELSGGSFPNRWLTDKTGNPKENFKNLRLVYMIACNSVMMTYEWKAAGAQTVIGHDMFNGLPMFFTQRFVTQWAMGRSAYESAKDAFHRSEDLSVEFRPYVEHRQINTVTHSFLNRKGVDLSRPVFVGADQNIDGEIFGPVATQRVFIQAKDPWTGNSADEAREALEQAEYDALDYDHSLFEDKVIKTIKETLREAPLRSQAIPSFPDLVRRHQQTLWNLLQGSFPPTSDARRFDNRVQLDGDTLRRIFEPFSGSALLAHIQMLTLTAQDDQLLVSVIFDEAFKTGLPLVDGLAFDREIFFALKLRSDGKVEVSTPRSGQMHMRMELPGARFVFEGMAFDLKRGDFWATLSTNDRRSGVVASGNVLDPSDVGLSVSDYRLFVARMVARVIRAALGI